MANQKQHKSNSLSNKNQNKQANGHLPSPPSPPQEYKRDDNTKQQGPLALYSSS
eukprot:m.111346 g.111346  ORF g.111346 m.111346 type:complete len:54 (+) comp15293_c0_seq1:3363-3524(+)